MVVGSRLEGSDKVDLPSNGRERLGKIFLTVVGAGTGVARGVSTWSFSKAMAA